jgi:CubicO group peptidase (beta-lactamase class C family)
MKLRQIDRRSHGKYPLAKRRRAAISGCHCRIGKGRPHDPPTVLSRVSVARLAPLPAFALERIINPRLAAVTLEQLLSHSSGIPSDTDEIIKIYFNVDAFQYNLPAQAQRLRALKKWKSRAPITKPGSSFHYANLGYLIAGAMIEKAAGVAWEELVITRVFTPLGLTTAGLVERFRENAHICSGPSASRPVGGGCAQ